MRKEHKEKQAKVEKVMHEFQRGNLYSSNGVKVTNMRQALAIAISEATRREKK